MTPRQPKDRKHRRRSEDREVSTLELWGATMLILGVAAALLINGIRIILR